MRPSVFSQLRPNSIELWYVVLATAGLILAGNGKLLLEKAGLTGSADLIGQQVSTKVMTGTNVVDTLRFTAGAINLVIWGATGLVIYSFLQSIIGTLRTIEYERDVDSKQYIHPQGYNHQAYWKEVATGGILGFALLALLAVFGFAYISIVVPDSFAFIHRFILTQNLQTALNLLEGIAIAFLGTLILYLLLKLVVRHHRTTVLEA